MQIILIAGFGRKVKVCLLSAFLGLALDTSGLAPDENVSRYTSAQTSNVQNDTSHHSRSTDKSRHACLIQII